MVKARMVTKRKTDKKETNGEGHAARVEDQLKIKFFFFFIPFGFIKGKVLLTYGSPCPLPLPLASPLSYTHK